MWERYRQGALQAYVATLITAGLGRMQAENIIMAGLAAGSRRSTTSTPCPWWRSHCDCDGSPIPRRRRHLGFAFTVSPGRRDITTTSCKALDVNGPSPAQRDAVGARATPRPGTGYSWRPPKCLGAAARPSSACRKSPCRPGVSRPTLYRWFASKEELLDAFGIYERQTFDTGHQQGDRRLARDRQARRRAEVSLSNISHPTGVCGFDVEPEVMIAQLP